MNVIKAEDLRSDDHFMFRGQHFVCLCITKIPQAEKYLYAIVVPWKSEDLWIKLSYPFFHADRIHTPTLFLGGEKDFNVPLVGGEQMYQALRSLGIDTQLVIYPNQFHGITVPSYKVDRYQRYLDWYAKYLRPAQQ